MERTDDLKETPICDCSCHNFGGSQILHFMECCGLIDKHYINTDGTINIEVWSVAFEKAYGSKPTFTINTNGVPLWVHR